MTEYKQTWIDRLFKGSKVFVLLTGIIMPQWFVLFVALVFVKDAAAYSFAQWFCGISLVGILAFLGINLGQKAVQKNNHS